MDGEGEGRLLEQRSIYTGKVVELTLDTVELPGGGRCDLEMIRHPGAAAVVPLDADGQVLLVRQYRHAASGWIHEVPAGKLDPGEDPETCALREVEEETGYRAGKLESLGWIYTTPGFTDEKIWLFRAEQLTRTAQRLQADEVLQVVRMPLAEALARATDGRIVDAKSICALLRLGRLVG